MKKEQWLLPFLVFYGFEMFYTLSVGPLTALMLLVDSLWGGLGILALAKWVVAWASFHFIYEREDKFWMWALLLLLPLRVLWISFEAPVLSVVAFAVVAGFYWKATWEMRRGAEAPQAGLPDSLSFCDRLDFFN